jgi:hypothetical protein
VKTSALFKILVSIFLALIAKRVLDTGVELCKGDVLEASSVFAGLSLVIIVVQNLMLFYRVSSEKGYIEILDLASFSLRSKLFVFAVLSLATMYFMAAIFTGPIGSYLVWSALLAALWFAFDTASMRTMQKHYGESESASILHSDPVLQAVRRWRACDLVLFVHMLAIWLALHFKKLDDTDAAVLTLLWFATVMYVVEHTLRSSTVIDSPVSVKTGSSRSLPVELMSLQ